MDGANVDGWILRRMAIVGDLVQEVASGKPGLRVFVVHSDEKFSYERAEHAKATQKVVEKLQALEQKAVQGKLKSAGENPLGCRANLIPQPRLLLLRLGTQKSAVLGNLHSSDASRHFHVVSQDKNVL